jgi:hypothetical protein
LHINQNLQDMFTTLIKKWRALPIATVPKIAITVTLILLVIAIVGNYLNPVPAATTYKITKRIDQSQYNKLILHVELVAAISKPRLDTLARDLRKEYSQWQILMVHYYIKGQKQQGAWAYSNFTPEPTIGINGLIE